jgi:glycosyltransferase involved in cell wall biosynthesis
MPLIFKFLPLLSSSIKKLTTISVIIPSFNGAKKLPNVLRSLEAQTFCQFQTIIVIDGSTDETLKILSEKTFNLSHLQIIYQENKGRAITRNIGAQVATGELLVFFDDDTRPVPSCIESHVHFHKQHPYSIAVGDVPEQLSIMKTDFQRYKSYLSHKWIANFLSNKQIPPDKPYLTAANFSISKLVFNELTGFDDRLSDAEDFDLAVRASEKKIPLYFLPDAIAWHDDFITAASYLRRLLQYTQAHSHLEALKPDLYKKYPQYQPSPLTPIKKLIYFFFSFPFWIQVIDIYNFLLVFPRRIRYLIYDLILTSQSIYYRNQKSQKHENE